MESRIVKISYGKESAYRGQIKEYSLCLNMWIWKDATPLVDRTCVSEEDRALEWCQRLLDLEVIRRGGGEEEYFYREEKED